MFKKPLPQNYEHILKLNGLETPVQVITSKRKTFSVTVYPDGKVVAKAPIRASKSFIANSINEKAAWIFKQKEKLKDYTARAEKKEYVEGEVFGYLGQGYKLKLIKSNTLSVNIEGENIVIKAKNITKNSIKIILKFWYQENAQILFAQRLEKFEKELEFLKLPKVQKLIVKQMKGKWGSCAQGGVITLNPDLMAGSQECIDYVIIHELCHLREHNHSPRYYKLLTAAMPTWKIHKQILNKTVPSMR